MIFLNILTIIVALIPFTVKTSEIEKMANEIIEARKNSTSNKFEKEAAIDFVETLKIEGIRSSYIKRNDTLETLEFASFEIEKNRQNDASKLNNIFLSHIEKNGIQALLESMSDTIDDKLKIPSKLNIQDYGLFYVNTSLKEDS